MQNVNAFYIKLESCQYFVAAPIRLGVHTDYWWLVGSAEAFAPSSPLCMPFLGLSFANDTGKSCSMHVMHILCRYKLGAF